MANEQYLKSMEDDKILGPFNTDDDEDYKEMIRATKYGTGGGGQVQNVSKKMAPSSSVVYATLAGIVIVGPFIGIMNSSLFISTTTLLLTSPLLLLFSPILIPAGLVLVAALLGFAVSAVMALAALSMFALSYRSYKNRPISTSLISAGTGTGTGDGGSGLVEEEVAAETFTESGQKVKQQVNELQSGILQKKAQVLPSSPPRQQHQSSKADQIIRTNKQAVVA